MFSVYHITYRGFTGGFLLLRNFSAAISHVCFIVVLILISVFLR